MSPNQTSSVSLSKKHHPFALTQHPGTLETLEFPTEQKSHFFEPALRSQAGVFWVMYVISCLQGLIKGPLHHGCDGMEP